jgi:drug/metabolite transporter (DMT)-like permease
VESRKGSLLIGIAALLYGFVTVGGRWLSGFGFSLLEVSFYPLAGVALILTLGRGRASRILFRRQNLRFFIGFGLVGAALQITQYGGIVLGVPVSIVAILLYLQPLWTLIVSRIWWGEQITPQKATALAISIAGMLVLLGPGINSSGMSRLGLGFALLGGWALSAWVLVGKRAERLTGVSAFAKTQGYALFTCCWLLMLAPVFSLLIGDDRLSRFGISGFAAHPVAVFVVALMAYLVPSCLFLAGVRGTSALTAGLIMMLEPVSAAVLAALLFREPLTWNILAGGFLVLLANALALPVRRRTGPLVS